MRALVFGESGQVARELALAAPARGIEATMLGRAVADLTNPEACVQAIRDADADVVVNAAAFACVDSSTPGPIQEGQPLLQGHSAARSSAALSSAS